MTAPAPRERSTRTMPRPAARTGQRLRVSALTARADVEALVPAWTDLFERCPAATPFQHPAWLVPWLDAFAESAPLLVVTVSRGSELVAVVPFYVYRDTADQPRRLLLLGSGNSDHLDGLFAPAYSAAAARDVMHFVTHEARGFDALEFQQLSSSSPLLGTPVSGAWTSSTARAEACPVLDLRGGITAAVPGGLLRRVAYLERRAGPSMRIRSVGRGELARGLDALERLHARRWRARGESGVLAEARTASFIRAAAESLSDAGLLRLQVMEIDGQPVAAHLGFARGTTACYYIGGFDPAYAKLSPGTLMVAHAIEQAAGDGAAAFDFLRGREEYKYRWGAKDVPAYTRRMEQSAA